MAPSIAVVGATGAVGVVMRQVLLEHSFRFRSIRFLASERSAGKPVTFKGKTYPFKLLGSVVGPGSISKISVTGDVYKLDDTSQFSGAWVEGTGAMGLETSQTGDVWLENKAGVVMHLTGTQTGVTLSLGRNELLIKLGNA